MPLIKIAIRGICLLLLVMGIAGTLKATEVHGTVRDIYNRPLAGVRVQVGESLRVFSTDASGAFAFTIDESSGVLALYFTAPQYHKEKRTLALENPDMPLNVYLIPLHQLKEDVTVTALNDTGKAVAVPFAQKVVSSVTIQEDQPESIVQAVQNSPGVHFIGKGGVSVTPSIRGLARRRVLLLVGGARITSDRSAGASAQFFPPEWVRQIEVVRSASSVLYGSDAIGGVIQVIPRTGSDPEAGFSALNLSGHSADDKLNGGFSLRGKAGDFSIRAAVQVARAGDYASGAGTVLNSGYSYYTGSLAVDYKTEKRSINLSFLKSAGRDIGKPERANDPDVASFYPEENAHLLTLSYRESGLVTDGSLNVSLFMNANDYELNKAKVASRQLDVSRNSAVDFGFRIFLKKDLTHRLSGQSGIDYYGRTGVDMENETWKNGVRSGSSSPVVDGRRGDLGLYATLAWSAPAGLDILAGARLGAFSRSALANGIFLEKSQLAPAIFLGVTRRIKDSLTIFINTSTAFRMPSLSEAFYSGITGRSSIVGNPSLDPERSFNLDAGIKLHGRDIFVGAYWFQVAIDAMIEKFHLGDTVYTYANIERGRIRGLELEFQYYPLKKLEIFGNGFYYRGSSTPGGGSLNDVPSARLFLGAKLWLGRIWGEINWLGAAAVRRPGPAEVVLPAYNITDLKIGGYFSNRLFLFAKIANLFNRVYYANADPDIPLARGVDFSVGLNLNL